MDAPILCLDTETATLRGAPHLLELGAVRFRDGEVVDTFDRLVRPEVEIDPGATDIHGIRDMDVHDAASAPEVLEEFVEWAGDDWMAAHNASFDARVLGFEFQRAHMTPPDVPMLDTLRLSRRFLPDAPDHKLDTLVAYLDLEDGDRHRALPDAVWCFKVLEACMAEMPEPVTREALLAICGRPVTIAEAGPSGPGTMKQRWRPLVAACEGRGAGEVTLVYGNEGEPPVELPVAPRLMYSAHKKGYLEAECLISGVLKTYRMDRIHKVRARSR